MTKRWGWIALAVSSLAGPSCGKAESTGCVPGASILCSCTSGTRGAKRCDDRGVLEECVCEADPTTAGSAGAGNAGHAGSSGASPNSGGPEAGADTGGTPGHAGGLGDGGGPVAGAPTDEGGAPGNAGFGDGGRSSAGAPTDAGSSGGGAGGDGAGAPGCEPEIEWCDGVDNDCDGVADDGEVCPDDTVANTDPFTGSVYFDGTLQEGLCQYVLQRVWPTFVADEYSEQFHCHARYYAFRPSDGAIFYPRTFTGVHQDIPGTEDDPIVPTPPCNENLGYAIGFDAQDTLHYQCGNTIRRGNGELVAESVERLVAVLADGRILATRKSLTLPGAEAFIVLGMDGSEVSRLDPQAQYQNGVAAVPTATTVSGNRAYVALIRAAPQQQYEFVLYRLLEDNAWQRMRRLVLPFYSIGLVLSDATVMVRQYDPTTGYSDEMIRAFLPTGEDVVIWREKEQTLVRSHGNSLLLSGPR